MNERIRELAKQAKQYTHDTVAHLERVHNRDFTFDEIDEVYDTKFAELIVRECANWINENVGMIDEDARADLYKHFGIVTDVTDEE